MLIYTSLFILTEPIYTSEPLYTHWQKKMWMGARAWSVNVEGMAAAHLFISLWSGIYNQCFIPIELTSRWNLSALNIKCARQRKGWCERRERQRKVIRMATTHLDRMAHATDQMCTDDCQHNPIAINSMMSPRCWWGRPGNPGVILYFPPERRKTEHSVGRHQSFDAWFLFWGRTNHIFTHP